MSTKHTPGPWIVEYRNRTAFDVFAPAAKTPDTPRMPKVAEVVSNGGKGIDEMRANAALIKEAPALLELAKAFVAYLEDDSQSPRRRAECLESARAAIARAKGQA